MVSALVEGGATCIGKTVLDEMAFRFAFHSSNFVVYSFIYLRFEFKGQWTSHRLYLSFKQLFLVHLIGYGLVGSGKGVTFLYVFCFHFLAGKDFIYPLPIKFSLLFIFN